MARTSSLVILLACSLQPATSFNPSDPSIRMAARHDELQTAELDRRSLVVGVGGMALTPVAASARGRGTQPAMFQRYSPRIVAYGEYIKSDLPKIVEASDWTALKGSVIAELNKKKGKIGPLYNGEAAMSLWAATYSETALTEKQKNMDARVAVLAEARGKLESIALKGTGEGLKKTGGFFGIGASTEPPPPPAVLKKEAMAAVAAAKQAYNEYVDINNAGIPFEIRPLPAI